MSSRSAVNQRRWSASAFPLDVMTFGLCSLGDLPTSVNGPSERSRPSDSHMGSCRAAQNYEVKLGSGQDSSRGGQGQFGPTASP